MAIAICFPRLSLNDGFFAYKYDCSGWTIYHESDSRKVVWHALDAGDARSWAMLPSFKRLAEARGFKAAITVDGVLEVYSPWECLTPFGLQSGLTVHRVTNFKQLRLALGCHLTIG